MSIQDLVPQLRFGSWAVLAPTRMLIWEDVIILEWDPRGKECPPPENPCADEADIGPPTRLVILASCEVCDIGFPPAGEVSFVFTIHLSFSFRRNRIWRPLANSLSWFSPPVRSFFQRGYEDCIPDPTPDCYNDVYSAGSASMVEWNNQIEQWAYTSSEVVGDYTTFLTISNYDPSELCLSPPNPECYAGPGWYIELRDPFGRLRIRNLYETSSLPGDYSVTNARKLAAAFGNPSFGIVYIANSLISEFDQGEITNWFSVGGTSLFFLEYDKDGQSLVWEGTFTYCDTPCPEGYEADPINGGCIETFCPSGWHDGYTGECVPPPEYPVVDEEQVLIWSLRLRYLPSDPSNYSQLAWTPREARDGPPSWYMVPVSDQLSAVVFDGRYIDEYSLQMYTPFVLYYNVTDGTNEWDIILFQNSPSPPEVVTDAPDGDCEICSTITISGTVGIPISVARINPLVQRLMRRSMEMEFFSFTTLPACYSAQDPVALSTEALIEVVADNAASIILDQALGYGLNFLMPGVGAWIASFIDIRVDVDITSECP